MSEVVEINIQIPTTEATDAASNNRLLILIGTLGALSASVAATGVLFGERIVQALANH